tara:strand:+ start:5184 stop:6368 length:1185 start_codon:yes stop_codon:yes gene_type:complete
MEEKNKEVVEKTTEKVVEKKEQPRDEKGKFTSKKKIKDDGIVKIDLSKPPPTKEEVVEEKENVVEELKTEIPKVEVPETKEQEVVEEIPVMEEITQEEKVEEIKEVAKEAIENMETTGKPLPENIQKLIEFMDETGGDLNDYVQLNRDVEKMDDSDVLDEYYKQTKSHLSPEERGFLLEDSFGIDEELDDEKTIRKKKIALKEQVAEARAHLDRQKSKYYEDIKAGSKLTEEQQKAIDFFNRSEEQKKQTEVNKRTFLNKTDSFFGQDFKGFEYNVGDKRYRFNVKNVDKVKTTQSDINNFVSKFTNEDNSTIEDAAGYHKSLFTAMNADAIAKHFYEQGKADAIKASVAKNKNINLEPRKMHGEYEAGGLKVKVLGQTSSDIKNRSFKIRKKN